MKLKTKFLSLSFLCLPLWASAQESETPADPTAQNATTTEGDPEKKPETPQFVLDLQSLPDSEKEEYGRLFSRADMLFKQKRIFECLETLAELHEIYDKNPASLNLMGACYVEFRNFDKARIVFAKTEEASPGNFNVRFNKAEIEFVSQNFEEALKQFEALLDDVDKNVESSGMIPILRFKTLLCRLKTGDVEGARELIADRNFLDNSPLFYYGNAALAYHADEGAKAEQWLARAGRIFGDDPNLLAPWQDTLIEFGYLKSFYGADLEVEDTGIPEVGGE